MNSNEILNELQKIFARHFDMDDVILTCETASNDIKGWDSFAHVTLLGDIEEKFDITFSGSEMVGFKNVGDIVEGIINKIHK